MQPARNFDTLHEAVSKRLNRLRLIANRAYLRPSNEFAESNREMSFIIIEFHSAIANFARSYFLSCTIKPKSKSGVNISCNSAIRNYADAIDAAMKACKNSVWRRSPGYAWTRRDEPSWHQPSTLINSSQEINCSYHTNILSAFSVPTRVFTDLTIFRNFYAHRNESTVSLARNLVTHYGITTTTSLHPTRILCTPTYNRPQPIILDWIDEVQITFDLLCQ